MASLNLKLLSTFSLAHLRCTPTTPFLYTLLSSFSSLSKTKSPNSLVANFLIDTLHFSQTRAVILACHNRYANVKSLQKPQLVIQYFQNLGFSQQQIRSMVHVLPQIILSDIEKTLKPKIEFFQQLGLSGSHLGNFLSRTPLFLVFSLEKKLVPTVELLRKILVNDKNNEKLFKVFRRSPWLIGSRLLPNVRYLESCGIVGSQLAFLLKNHHLFFKQEAALRNLVSKVSDLGFKPDSRKFIYALDAVTGNSAETFQRKVRTFERFGLYEDEYMEMFRKLPQLLNTSIKKSIIGLDFYLNTLKLRKEVLICNPPVLTYSMEKRVLPRYRVLQTIMSKQLSKKKHNFTTVVKLTEVVFLEKFISKFPDHAEELLIAYKGHNSNPSSQEKMSTS